MSALSKKALEIAKGYIGQKEVPDGSNWGPFVKACLALVGINFAAFWCMSFVYRCFDEAAKALGLPNPLVKTGGVMDAYNRTGALHRVTDPQPGDIFILDLGKGKGHTGIVDTVVGKKFQAVEGNSNDDGSHNGNKVCTPKWRNNSSVKCFLRF